VLVVFLRRPVASPARDVPLIFVTVGLAAVLPRSPASWTYAVHPSELPEASTPAGAWPLAQFVPLAAKALAVAALPVVDWFSVGMSAAASEHGPNVVALPHVPRT